MIPKSPEAQRMWRTAARYSVRGQHLEVPILINEHIRRGSVIALTDGHVKGCRRLIVHCDVDVIAAGAIVFHCEEHNIVCVTFGSIKCDCVASGRRT